jgi:hypothetical protein
LQYVFMLYLEAIASRPNKSINLQNIQVFGITEAQ